MGKSRAKHSCLLLAKLSLQTIDKEAEGVYFHYVMTAKPSSKILHDFTPARLNKFLGKKVEIVAFGLAYKGELMQVDLKSWTVKIADTSPPSKDTNYAILEIERIDSLKIFYHA